MRYKQNRDNLEKNLHSATSGQNLHRVPLTHLIEGPGVY